MARLFSKLRIRFIAEKRFRNYLLYAIGEIFLLVIGILIALAINNANQNRITRVKEQTYLVGLKNEFQTSKLKLQELMEVNLRNYEGAKTIVKYISGDHNSLSEKQFSEVLYNTFAFDVSFNPNNSLLNEMISSGSLKDIANTELRKQLTNWISTMEDITRQENDLGRQREKVLDMFRTNETSIRTIFDLTGVSGNVFNMTAGPKPLSNLKLLNSTQFENNILMFMLTCHATDQNHYQPLMQDLESILRLIQGEIQN